MYDQWVELEGQQVLQDLFSYLTRWFLGITINIINRETVDYSYCCLLFHYFVHV